ncbi:MAG: DNA-processing protein DprA [Microthrixaceae bacterium]
MSDLPHEAYLAALAGIDGVGPVRMRWLLGHGDPEHVWGQLVSGRLRPGPIRHESNSGRIDADQISKWRAEASRVRPEEIWRRCVKLGVGVVSLGSPGYPPALADDLEPPVVLFQMGYPEALNGPRVAIVGTRRATGYGLGVAESLGAELAERGVVVVSGLALGIDAAAHRGALGLRSGSADTRGLENGAAGSDSADRGLGASVVAVVANGLDSPCPSRNRQLAKRVVDRGVIYSEVPPGMPSAPWRFPVRNRVIAALADVVVVVESAGAGGSMHTVREALTRDRPVLAVPGPVNSRASEGVNQLIRDGAAPCLGVEDVMMALGLPDTPDQTDSRATLLDRTKASVAQTQKASGRQAQKETRREPTGNEALVLESLDWRPATLDSLAAGTGLGLRDLAKALSNLESDGWILRTGGWVERCA